MRRRGPTDAERAFEALASRGETPEDADDLARLVTALRRTASPVEPRDELRQLFAEGLDVTDAAPTRRPVGIRQGGRRMIEGFAAKVAGVGLAAKLGLASAVVVAGVSGGGVAGALPGPAQDAFDRVVGTQAEELPEEADFGQEVSDDARDGGVDGDEVSEDARERFRPVDPDDPPGADDPATQGEADGGDGLETADDASEGRFTEGRETAGERSEDADGQVGTPADRQTGDDTPHGSRDTGEERRDDAGGDAADEGGDEGDAEPAGGPQTGDDASGDAGGQDDE